MQRDGETTNVATNHLEQVPPAAQQYAELRAAALANDVVGQTEAVDEFVARMRAKGDR
jgi:hypothetical protein